MLSTQPTLPTYSSVQKRGDISGYVHSISQMKTSKTSHVQYFSALIQTREKTWHVSSYSHEKHEHLMGFQAVQQAVKITNAAFVPSKRRVETLDVFIDKRSELESTSVDFPFTNTAAESGSDEYTNLSDVLKMQHRDKVSVCVKILSEETSDDVTLDDGTVTKRAIFRVADGSLSTQGQQVINVSIYGKNMIKKIRNMPIARLKNMVVHVSDGQVSLSTHDNSSITSRKEEERCSGLASCNCSNCKDPEVSSQMPCWYFEKDDLQFTSSFFDGVDPDTEARYRREGARFILDTGTKMGLKFDSCATGVVYFHRFYMIHSFREFNRYVTGACCLFLAGKVEETPKKCKDIIKATREMLSESQFSAFGDDPKEEVMTLERILLQTIKFDLRVEHPYSYILKYAKQIKGDKDKVQKLIQMAWTFINDSMCTTLCLQWESDMIAVALMYLAGRLTKHEITDWHGKQPGTKKKWWDSFVEDATMDLLEDICHQVLDLYSAPVVKRESSPPLQRHDPQVMMAAIKQRELQMQQAKQQEQMQQQTQQQQLHQKRAPEKGKRDSSKKAKTAAVASHAGQSAVKTELLQAGASQSAAAGVAAVAAYAYPPPNQNFMSAQNESSSFMSGEGAQSLRSLMGSYPAASTADAQYSYPQYGQYTYPQYTQAQSAAHATQSYAHAQTDPANAQYYPYYQQQQQQQQQQQGHPQQQYAQQYGQQYYTQAAQAGAYAPNSAHTVTYAQTPQYPQTTYAATTLAYAPATYAQSGHYTQATTNQTPYTTNHYAGQ